MGRAAGGGTGRSWGMGKFKIDTAQSWLSHPIRGASHTQENQQGEHRDTEHGNHRVLGSRHFPLLSTTRSFCLQTSATQMGQGLHSYRYSRTLLPDFTLRGREHCRERR